MPPVARGYEVICHSNWTGDSGWFIVTHWPKWHAGLDGEPSEPFRKSQGQHTCKSSTPRAKHQILFCHPSMPWRKLKKATWESMACNNVAREILGMLARKCRVFPPILGQKAGGLIEKPVCMIIWLVVGPPLWKIWTSIGMISNPIYGKIKNVPNHQPVIIWIRLSGFCIDSSR